MWLPLLGDARYALRLSRRSPLASFAIIATMVLGIGSTTAVFSAMNAILLKPLPFPDSQHVRPSQRRRAQRTGDRESRLPDLIDFRRKVPGLQPRSRSISRMTRRCSTETIARHPYRASRRELPTVFGTRVALGRWLLPGDLAVNAPKVALLSHDFWIREFGGESRDRWTRDHARQ